MISRPRPRVESGTNPAIANSQGDARRKAAESLIGAPKTMVPSALTHGAEAAQERRAARSRAKAMRLDILMKRRTDSEDGGGGGGGGDR